MLGESIEGDEESGVPFKLLIRPGPQVVRSLYWSGKSSRRRRA